jgi:serine/threonine protein kinase
VDIFALGVLAFMMCFQKPPFESRLSAINNQYFLPDEHNYSPELVALIQKCFTPNPENRPSATEVKEELK